MDSPVTYTNILREYACLLKLGQNHSPGDPLTHWLRSSGPDDNPDVTQIKDQYSLLEY